MTLRHILVAEATPSCSLATLASKPSSISTGASSRGAGAAEQQRHLDPVRRHRGHHRALDIAAAGAVDQAAARIFAPGDAELKSRNKAPCAHARRAGLRHRHRLARGDRRDDQIGLRARASACDDASATPMSARARAAASPLSSSSLRSKALTRTPSLAQILGEDAADLAVADEADMPLIGSNRHRSISRCTSGRPSPAARASCTCRGPARPAASLARLSPSLASRAAAASAALLRHRRGNHDHAVVVGDDHVARVDAQRRRRPPGCSPSRASP